MQVFCVPVKIHFYHLIICILLTASTQIPVIQTCVTDAACRSCTNSNIIVINNGRVTGINIRRIIRDRFLNTVSGPRVDVCCSGCQPIIGDVNTQKEGDPTTASCSVTCDYAQNTNNLANLVSVGALSSFTNFGNTLLNGFGSFRLFGAFNGFGGANLFSGLLFDSNINVTNSSTEFAISRNSVSESV